MAGLSAPLAAAARPGLASPENECWTPSDANEPDIVTALGWWTELPNKWMPIGWKDHLFRFNVLFNGTIVAQPDLNRRTQKWLGQGVQLSFAISSEEGVDRFPQFDDGRVLQSWSKNDTPTLTSEWTSEGLSLRQEIFAHIPGAVSIQSGIEPLFAWIRLSIVGITEGLPLEERYAFAIKLNAPHISRSMEMRNNLTYHLDKSRYPRSLSPEVGQYSSTTGYRLLEPDGKVRLGVATGQECSVTFESGQPTAQDLLLFIQMDTRRGSKVDLLVPMLPSEREAFDEELALGYEAALRESNLYWSNKPAGAAAVWTPEEHINQTILCSLKTAEIIAERDPATGYYSLLTGSWTYADVWATPLAMTCVFCLDNFGYHEVVEKYLRVFKETQGSVIPPGKGFSAHPGYLATPRSLTAINWMTDHGALLWAISNHVLVAGNKQYEEEWIPVVTKACDFVKEARRIRGHGGVEGIMPPAVATDRRTEIQAVWSDGWAYKGLIKAAKLLGQANHPRASEFATELQAYKEHFEKAIKQKAKGMPAWADSRGGTHHLAPPCLYGNTQAESRHAFFLDAGPLMLVFSGLLDASDDLMRSTLLWFREGPPTKVYRYDSNCWQVPSLHREVSSCEPGFSWNLFHSHQLADRDQFIEGMYSLLSASFSRETFTICETRGGITGITPCHLALYAIRLAVIDDQLNDDELHLLRLVPLAWLKHTCELTFQNVPTEFGLVSVRARLGRDSRELQISYAATLRFAPKRVVLHVPPIKNLRQVTLNDRDLNWDGTAPMIVIN